MAAGDIARSLNVPANTASAQLLVLSNAGLVRARRDGRSIIYAINFEAMRGLLVFLTADCCGGRPEMCAPLAGIASHACCETPAGGRHEAPARSRRRR
ncbi:MAG TPA: helix-turn-helix domain-containing protein [Rhizomicrobium sp.]|jgi:DNA-binding transcriptional ArsR family regulator|nr:helix-turn-helix domain-containing protein [Rhizomicrobium sp.]